MIWEKFSQETTTKILFLLAGKEAIRSKMKDPHNKYRLDASE
jgi:hypothetical protein